MGFAEYPAIHLGYGETMASIDQGAVGEAPCVALAAAEQLLEAICIVPVVPVAFALQRAGAALAVGNMIVT